MSNQIIRRCGKISAALAGSAIPSILKKVYANRNISSEHELDYRLVNLPPAEGLLGIDKAVTVIAHALACDHRITVIGDFDADGATSTALAVHALRVFGGKHVRYLVPNRFDFGYGLTPEIVDIAASTLPHLLITVDNGISSCDGVEHANALGMDVVITDHHLPGDQLPAACAIVNPNQPGDTFKSKNLAGVGVIFYVMIALRQHLEKINWFSTHNLSRPNMGQYLDLVALGTVADVVPLDHVNRILVSQGIERIKNYKARIGITALLDVSNKEAGKLTAADLGFAIGPRLNAAGRLKDMKQGIECLLSEKVTHARNIAQELDQLNLDRKKIEKSMLNEANHIVSSIKFNGDIPVGLCVYHENWHQGVIGIVASRIKERFNRPTIVFCKHTESELKGSARSIPGVHIRDVLDRIAKQHPECISKFGGHAMAAGLTIRLVDREKFTTLFAKTISCLITPDTLALRHDSDGELTHQDLNLQTVRILSEGGPWGQGFPPPVFDNVFKVNSQRLLQGRHLKLSLSLVGESAEIDAIAFNIDSQVWPNHRCTHVHVVYKLDINEYMARRRVQCIVDVINEVTVQHDGHCKLAKNEYA